MVTRVATTAAGTTTTATTGAITTPASSYGSGTAATTTGTLGTAPTATVDKAAALHAITSKATATVHLTTFRSPSGNIGCVVLDGTARCDISHRSWKPPARPPSCSREVNFGQGLQVGGSGKGTLVCAGDTALDPMGTQLRYGDASVEGDFACVSAFTGMTCTNLTNAHGFFISRQSYRVF